MRRTRIRRESDKQRAIRDERRRERQQAWLRGQRCEFPGCTAYADDWHERLPRSQGGDPLSASERAWLCRPHHSWCHDNPAKARELGLRRWSWEGEK